MGIGPKFSDNNVCPPNPDPTHYRILTTERGARYFIYEVHYYGCTSFGGSKLLLLQWEPADNEPLDPHLTGDNVVARFEPNEEGWRLARLCAN